MKTWWPWVLGGVLIGAALALFEPGEKEEEGPPEPVRRRRKKKAVEAPVAPAAPIEPKPGPAVEAKPAEGAAAT